MDAELVRTCMMAVLPRNVGKKDFKGLLDENERAFKRQQGEERAEEKRHEKLTKKLEKRYKEARNGVQKAEKERRKNSGAISVKQTSLLQLQSLRPRKALYSLQKVFAVNTHDPASSAVALIQRSSLPKTIPPLTLFVVGLGLLDIPLESSWTIIFPSSIIAYLLLLLSLLEGGLLLI